MADSTKAKLADSLRIVLKKKPLDKITITDLTTVCGVNRQTFYYHFHDIYDLVDWIYLSEGDRALGHNKTYDTWQEGVTDIMKLMRDNHDFILQTFHSRSGGHLERILLRSSSRIIMDVCDEVSDGKLNENDKLFLADFYKYAFTGVILEWVERGMKEDPSAIVRRMDLLIHGNFKGAIKRFSGRR